MAAPINLSLNSESCRGLLSDGIMVVIRRSPYAPNFRRILARIIDPATDASVWALGNHKWREYIGNLTRKAAKVAYLINQTVLVK